MFMYWIDPIASFIASWVCCACIGPLLICFLGVVIELASYSHMSECSCFKLMNHNPKSKFKFVTARKLKGAEAYHQLRKRSYVLTNYVLTSLLVMEANQNWKSFKTIWFLDHYERLFSLNVRKYLWRKL